MKNGYKKFVKLKMNGKERKNLQIISGPWPLKILLELKQKG